MSVTPKQKEVLDFIVQFINEQGYPPSYREIAEGLNLASPSTVHVHIQALRERGFLRANGGNSRELEPTDKAVRWGRSVMLPLAGTITAGVPIEAIQEHETMAIPVDLAPDSANSYVLRVKGESMISISRASAIRLSAKFCQETGILNHDYAVLFYDSEKKAIGILPTNKNVDESFTLTKERTSGSISAAGFMNRYNLDADIYHGRYEWTTERLPSGEKVYVVLLKRNDEKST